MMSFDLIKVRQLLAAAFFKDFAASQKAYSHRGEGSQKKDCCDCNSYCKIFHNREILTNILSPWQRERNLA